MSVFHSRVKADNAEELYMYGNYDELRTIALKVGSIFSAIVLLLYFYATECLYFVSNKCREQTRNRKYIAMSAGKESDAPEWKDVWND